MVRIDITATPNPSPTREGTTAGMALEEGVPWEYPLRAENLAARLPSHVVEGQGWGQYQLVPSYFYTINK